MPNHYGLIMAGGRGTRFWPRSRRRRAKQVLNVVGERTLIQQTVDRLRPIIPPDRIWVLTNEFLRGEIVRQLPDVPKRQVLAEPAQRNTAPCNALAAHILASFDPEAVIGVFPADHVVGNAGAFSTAVQNAFQTAEQGRLVVIGLQPRWADTGYGYIEFPQEVETGSVSPVLRFREKPDEATARQYVESGRFFWNSGMFFWRADAFLKALREHRPAIADIIDALPPFTSRRFVPALREAYPRCEDISVDYAVMESAENVVGFPAGDLEWSDVGSWHAVYELLPRDAAGNAARSELLSVASAGNYVDAGRKLVALLGVRDLVIVDTPDALLVTDRKQAQKVGELVKLLEKQGRDELL